MSERGDILGAIPLPFDPLCRLGREVIEQCVLKPWREEGADGAARAAAFEARMHARNLHIVNARIAALEQQMEAQND